MGTGFDMGTNGSEQGIIPRAVEQLFNGISSVQAQARESGEPIPDFKVNAQFLGAFVEFIMQFE